MAAPKKPQDHKKKAKKADERFSFEVDGKTYTFKPTKEILTRTFYRKSRKGTPADQLFDMVEALAEDEETLEAFDSIPDEDFDEVFETPFYDHVKEVQGATPGESSAS